MAALELDATAEAIADFDGWLTYISLAVLGVVVMAWLLHSRLNRAEDAIMVLSYHVRDDRDAVVQSALRDLLDRKEESHGGPAAPE